MQTNAELVQEIVQAVLSTDVGAWLRHKMLTQDLEDRYRHRAEIRSGRTLEDAGPDGFRPEPDYQEPDWASAYPEPEPFAQPGSGPPMQAENEPIRYSRTRHRLPSRQPLRYSRRGMCVSILCPGGSCCCLD